MVLIMSPAAQHQLSTVSPRRTIPRRTEKVSPLPRLIHRSKGELPPFQPIKVVVHKGRMENALRHVQRPYGQQIRLEPSPSLGLVAQARRHVLVIVREPVAKAMLKNQKVHHNLGAEKRVRKVTVFSNPTGYRK